MTECLAAMAEIDDRGRTIDLPHLVGQRFEALSCAIDPKGPFAREGGIAFAKLTKLRDRMELRNMLCHGTTNITLDLHGRWTAVLRLASLRSKRIVREQLAVTQAEAEDLAQDIVVTSRQLCSQLSQVRFQLQSRR